MVELRKRPPPKETATPAPAPKKGSGAGAKMKKLADRAKETLGVSATPDEANEPTSTTADSAATATEPTPAAAAPAGKIGVGSHVSLDGFGGTVTTNDGAETTMKDLIEKSGAGVVVFTYPKASTPGCTTQACLFRDSYHPISGASLAVYGLSTDSPKSNTTFVTKHSLPFPLLCDPGATLTTAIGMKKPGPGKSTTRGVIIIDKQGTVKLWEQAGPQKTLDAVLEYIKTEGMTETGAPPAVAAPPADDPADTEAAAKLADPFGTNGDSKMDEVPLTTEASKEEEEAATTAAEVGETAAKLDTKEEATT